MSAHPPEISILLVTFNHELYVDQALASIASQGYGGAIEVVVADDASTDSTLERIRAWAAAHEDRLAVRFLEVTENLGITRNYQRGFAACAGRYVAILEGDDYWTSPNKLARQIDFLNEHLECNLCSTNYFVYDEDCARFTPRTDIAEGHILLSARQLIADNVVGNFSACVYRNDALANLPPRLFEMKSYDWIVNICIARNSLIGYLNAPMSVYRIHSGGAWSSSTTKAKIMAQRDAIDGYNALTNGIFSKEFTDLRRRLELIVGKRPLQGEHALGVESVQTGENRRSQNWRQRLVDVTPPFLIWAVKWAVPPMVLRAARRLVRGPEA